MENNSDLQNIFFKVKEIGSERQNSEFLYNSNSRKIQSNLNSLKKEVNFNENLPYILIDLKKDIITKFQRYNDNFATLESSLLKLKETKYKNINLGFLIGSTEGIYLLNNKLKENIIKLAEINKKLKTTLANDEGHSVTLIPTEGFLTELIEEVTFINKTILMYLSDIIKNIESSTIFILEKINSLESEEINYQKRFEEESQLVIKKFNHEVENLLKGFRNEIASFKLDQNSLTKRNISLTKDLEENLKNIKIINEKTQNLDLTLSKMINNENIKIVEELNQVKLKAEELISPIILEIQEKKTGIETTYSDFKNLVENAGIYDLTKNYKDKADEEKEEYRTYRKHTTNAIIAAIVSTLAIFIIAFIEHAIASQEAQTNYLLLVSRLSISLMFFVLALYLSKQAAKHYECYQENHRTFLQLAALEPFMARMTPEEQKEIRKGLIPSYFNQANDEKYTSKGEDVALPEAFKNLPDKIVEAIKTRTNPPSNS